jgi:hypothetical protein
MPSASGNSPPSIKIPTCPECGTDMRLERATPDSRYINLHHMIFMCACGQSSDQLVAHAVRFTPRASFV